MKDGAQRRKAEEELAMHLAETTDVSPEQARALIRKHGDNREEIIKAAKNFKAES